MTFAQIPDLPLVLGEDRSIRLPLPGEDLTAVVGLDWDEIEVRPRKLLVRRTPGGQLNANATVLAGRPVFGNAILTNEHEGDSGPD